MPQRQHRDMGTRGQKSYVPSSPSTITPSQPMQNQNPGATKHLQHHTHQPSRRGPTVSQHALKYWEGRHPRQYGGLTKVRTETGAGHGKQDGDVTPRPSETWPGPHPPHLPRCCGDHGWKTPRTQPQASPTLRPPPFPLSRHPDRFGSPSCCAVAGPNGVGASASVGVRVGVGVGVRLGWGWGASVGGSCADVVPPRWMPCGYREEEKAPGWHHRWVGLRHVADGLPGRESHSPDVRGGHSRTCGHGGAGVGWGENKYNHHNTGAYNKQQ